jgi:hypothetical protein
MYHSFILLTHSNTLTRNKDCRASLRSARHDCLMLVRRLTNSEQPNNRTPNSPNQDCLRCSLSLRSV